MIAGKKSEMVNRLRRHLDGGGFESLYNQHLRLLRSRPRHVHIRKERGAEAAEAELTRRLSPVVAQTLQPIAAGVLEILCAPRHIDAVMFARGDSMMPFPLPETAVDPYGIVIFNPQLPNNVAVRGYDDFGRGRDLGLRAVMLGMDDYNMSLNEVSLIFDDKRPGHRADGVTYVRLSRVGSMDAGALSFTPQRNVLDYALGLGKLPKAGRYEAHHRVSEVLAHDADQEFPAKLGLLVTYLRDIKHVLELDVA